MEIRFDRNNGVVDEQIDALIAQVGLAGTAAQSGRLVREMILSALKAGQEISYPADLKLMRTTMKEMRFTAKVFGPHRGRRKVTIFGSARTESDEPIYQKCVEFSRLLAEHNYMVITGGGGGIMQAGNEGAGAENSFAINISLPFEQSTNPVMVDSPNVITYKYFFNRKIAFLKEADAVALFPGGFGTLDEAMETLTLIQTGKNPPIPLVLVDDDHGGYWENLFSFMRNTLLKRGLISGEDFGLFTLTRSPEEAVQVINDFYRVYHSSRYIGEDLVIRTTKELSAAEVDILQNEFSEILSPGQRITTASVALDKESDQPDLLLLPRLIVPFNHRNFGLLIAFIRRINSF
ncbi:MAG: TIGR00730 family Rossman fold protein [Desulfuromonadales bacterium]|nr:TIGR00730 family Rossman fold protein [Desulfuromonadales bacterium]